MNTQAEEMTEEQSLALLKQQIQQVADESKEANAWIVKEEQFIEEQKQLLREREEMLKEKKAQHKALIKRARDLIKVEHSFTGRSPVNQAGALQRGAMNSKIYGHAVEDVSHRQFANNL